MGLPTEEFVMDDLYALEGGRSATAWQRKHNRRKAHEAALKTRRALRAEAKVDLKKRTTKWRAKWKVEAARCKAAGLHLPGKQGRPRDISKSNIVDMTGWRFGRLTVIRVAPTSKQGNQQINNGSVSSLPGPRAEENEIPTNKLLRQLKVIPNA
jgi:hypothetical protein